MQNTRIMLSNGRSLEVYNCSDIAESPREDGGNLGIIVSLEHRHYNLPNEERNFSFSQTSSFEEAVQCLRKKHKAIIVLPVYMYEHGNVCFSTKPFSCPWDSAQSGFIFTTKQKIREQLGIKRITKNVLNKAVENLINEIERYSEYTSGNIFGYSLFSKEKELEDSCSGFIGSDFNTNGMIDNLNLPQEDKKLILEKL